MTYVATFNNSNQSPNFFYAQFLARRFHYVNGLPLDSASINKHAKAYQKVALTRRWAAMLGADKR